MCHVQASGWGSSYVIIGEICVYCHFLLRSAFYKLYKIVYTNDHPSPRAWLKETRCRMESCWRNRRSALFPLNGNMCNYWWRDVINFFVEKCLLRTPTHRVWKEICLWVTYRWQRLHLRDDRKRPVRTVRSLFPLITTRPQVGIFSTFFSILKRITVSDLLLCTSRWIGCSKMIEFALFRSLCTGGGGVTDKNWSGFTNFYRYPGRAGTTSLFRFFDVFWCWKYITIVCVGGGGSSGCRRRGERVAEGEGL